MSADEEGSSESESDEDWDYGWQNDDDDDEEFSLDLTNVNVSSDVLRLLGKSEEEIAAVKAKNATDWKPPEHTGMQNSKPIANFEDVSLVRPVAAAATSPQVEVVKIVKPMETVPDARAHALPPRPQPIKAAGTADAAESDSEEEWDEASWASWSDVDSDDEPENLQGLSPNLLRMLGRVDLAAKVEAEVKQHAAGGAGGGGWVPPVVSGVANSTRIMVLTPVNIGVSKPIETRPARPPTTEGGRRASLQGEKQGQQNDEGGGGGGGGQEEEDDWGGGDDDDYDYEEVDDDEYLADLSTKVSANLASLISSNAQTRSVMSQLTSDWRPPERHGLENSAPLVDFKKNSKPQQAVAGAGGGR